MIKPKIDLSIWDLSYWQSGEWQVIEERLDDHEMASEEFVPDRRNLFRALKLCPLRKVRCAIIGQDPYPGGQATGIAFDTGPGLQGDRREAVLPPTLINIFKEYQTDLGYPEPADGNLMPWVKEGVLLWNAYPSCLKGKPGSHHWDEYKGLTNEILTKINQKGRIPVIFLGQVAQGFSHNITDDNCIIATSHPSPLGARYGFTGSKIFTKVNEKLREFGLKEINWRLPDAQDKGHNHSNL